MENLFIGFRLNGVLYGAKSYIGNENEWSKSLEIVMGFYKRNSLIEMKNLFNSISWKSIDNGKRINNGFTLLALLKEDTIERYASYHQEVKLKIDKKGVNRDPLYNPLYFEEKNGTMYATFKDHGKIFDEYKFEKTYIIDLDCDTLIIEDLQKNEKEELKRKHT
jgi:hypothetical protein